MLSAIRTQLYRRAGGHNSINRFAAGSAIIRLYLRRVAVIGFSRTSTL